MPQEFKPGCARPTGGIVGAEEKDKRAQNDQDKFKKIFWYFLAGLIIIFITIPWPFTQMGAGRGWF